MPKRFGRIVAALWLCQAAALQAVVPATASAAPAADKARAIPGQRNWLDDPAMAASLAKLDPAADGWDSEVLAAAASRQLDRIVSLWTSGKSFDAATLSGVAAAGYAGGALRPPKLEEAFRDASVVVLRGRGDDAARYRGADGLAKSLAELTRSMQGRGGIRVELPIVALDMKADALTAVVRAHASATGPGGTLEQTATWRTRWTRPQGSAPPMLEAITILDYEEVAGSRGPIFSDVTEAVLGGNRSFREDLLFGIDHWLERLESWIETDAFGHHGIAVGDVNGDGLDDIYVCQMAGLPNLLFVQNPDGTATDVSAAAGVDWLERTRSALFLDIDNDGDEDLVIATSVALLFMENDGKGRFTVRASLSADGMITAGPPPAATRTGGIPEEGMAAGHYQRSGDFGAVKTSDIVSLAAADYDNDGLIDIYACVYHASGEQADRFPLPLPYHDANNGGANVMIRNDGGWRFSNVTKSSGLDANNRRFSFAASWEDYDNDGDQDLYVANDFGRNNLYRNDGGHFTDVAAQAGVEDIAAGMSVSWADYDNDGWMDLYVGNMYSAAGARIAPQEMFKKGSPADVLAAYRHHEMGNTLYRNAHDGKFADVSGTADVGMGRWAWSSNFIDLDNDGWEDLMVANGYFTRDTPDDLSSFFWREVVGRSPDTAVEPAMAADYAHGWQDLGRMIRRGRSFAGHERNVAFLNTRGGRFANVSATTGLDFPDDARAVAVTDWDGDGDLDVWIANRTGPRLRLARNDAPAGNHHLSLLLEGRKANRDAIGARVELQVGGAAPRRIITTVHAGDGYLAQSSKWVHFGLGDATAIDALAVQWPGGGRETFKGLAADGRYRIVEGSGAATAWSGPPRHVSLAASRLEEPAPADGARLLLSAPVPAPSLEHEKLDGSSASPEGAGPLLVYLWSTGDAGSVSQLGDMAKRADELKSRGLRVLALSVDGVDKDEPPDPAPALRALESARFPFDAGFAYPELIAKLDLVLHKVFWQPRPMPVPTSLLIDADGLLAAVYEGRLSIDQLIADLPALRTTGERRLSLAIPFAGQRQTRGTPDFYDYMDSIAEAYSAGGFPDEAVAHYRKVLRIQPARAKAHYGLGLALAAMGQRDEAIAEYRETVKVDPGNVAALADLGYALAGQGKTQEAADLYRKAIEIDPNNVAALCDLASLLADQQKLDEAIALYRRAIERDPQNLLALNNLAVALARQGKDDEAIGYYQRVLKSDPGNGAARINLANALTRQGRSDDAVAQLEEAIRIRPKQAETRYALGMAQVKRGKIREAIEQLAEAVRLNPGLVQAQYYLGLALARDGRTDDATRRFAEVLKVAADSPDVPERLAWLLATNQEPGLREGKKAIELAQTACAATGNQKPGPLDALGAAYAEAGRFDDAVAAAKKALDLATAGGDAAGAEKIKSRIALYEARKPYRE